MFGIQNTIEAATPAKSAFQTKCVRRECIFVDFRIEEDFDGLEDKESSSSSSNGTSEDESCGLSASRGSLREDG